MADWTFIEAIYQPDASSLAAELQSGRSVIPYQVQYPEPVALTTLLRDILGWTDLPNTAGNDHRLVRNPPIGHPLFTGWFAKNIVSVKTMGPKAVTVAQSDTIVNINANIDEFLLYQIYEVNIAFEPFIYTVRPDTDISNTTSYFTNPSGNRVDFNYAEEWLRYTDLDVEDRQDIVRGDLGAMRWNAVDLVRPPSTFGPSYVGTISMDLQDSGLKVYWYGIPYRYVTDPHSWLRALKNRINWRSFMGYGEGALLYEGCSVKKYCPPVMIIDETQYPTINWPYKVCDVCLSFLETSRLPSSTVNVAVANGNNVILGHNLMPHPSKRRFFYVESSLDRSPAFFAAPFELLFSNPLLPGIPSLADVLT